jgi:V8-like Glu-specific endopeptidase
MSDQGEPDNKKPDGKMPTSIKHDFVPLTSSGPASRSAGKRPRLTPSATIKRLGSRTRLGFLQETYAGGELEIVPGYRSKHAMVAGLDGVYTMARNGSTDVPDNANETVFYDPYDDREQIFNTAQVPWRAICHLEIQRSDGSVAVGTGWFASPSMVVTAGHNYLDHNRDTVATAIFVTAGHDGTTSPPFPPTPAVDVYVPPEWERQADPSYDYALLRVTDASIGNRTGYFGFSEVHDEVLDQGVLVNLAGYPIDKPFATMWYSAGRLFHASSSLAAHRIDTEGGFSGAPLVFKSGEQRVVVGMHIQGDSSSTSRGHNLAVRIAGTFYDHLVQAIS